MKYNSEPTRTENSLAYHIASSSVDYQENSFFFHTVREIGIVFLMTLFMHWSLITSGITSYHELYLSYSTNSGERESRPFDEEPETPVSILISTTVLHLDFFVRHSALPTAHRPTAI